MNRKTPVSFLAALLGLAVGPVSNAADNPANVQTTGSLSGKITAAANQAPLAGAVVAVRGTSFETSTDREGDYRFNTLPAGRYVVEASYVGLPSTQAEVDIRAGLRATTDMKMGEQVITLQAFTVSGQRAGQARAINLQRSSENLKEIVSSDAIGRFPDLNAAESLQRLTGVALVRDEGEGRSISIRGLHPDLNNTQIDGVNLLSAESDTRRAQLDSISLEQFDSIELTKALTPDMDGDAIGGTVNLKTRTAFSQEGRTLNLAAEGNYTHFGDKWGHKFALVAGDKFLGDRLGILVTLNEQQRYITAVDNITADVAPRAGFQVPSGTTNLRTVESDRRRRTANVSLDFRPTDQDELFVRGSYNTFSEHEVQRRLAFQARTQNATGLSDFQGTVTGRTLRPAVKDRVKDNDLWAVSTGGVHHRGSFKLDWIASFSHGDEVDPHHNTPRFDSPNTSFTYDYSNLNQPVFGGAYLNLPLTAYMSAVMDRQSFTNSDEEAAFAINLRRDFAWREQQGYWKIGGKYRQREKDVNTDRWLYNHVATPSFSIANVHLPSTLNPGAHPYLTFDSQAFVSYFRSNPDRFIFNPSSDIDSRVEDYVSNEDVTSAYAMGNITLGQLTLLAGLRFENTEFRAKGWMVPSGANPNITRTSAANDYQTFLPSLHARYKFSSQLQGRASITQSLARPSFKDSAFRVSIDDLGNYRQGNVKLEPYRSDNLDVSVEFYPSRSLGMLTAGVFAKRIENFIFTQTIVGGAPDGVHDLTTPLNGKAGTILGAEFAYQQQFTFLPSPFDGLGFYVNYTLTDGDADLGSARPGIKTRFPEQPKRIANLALSYEKYGFFIRAALNHRGELLDEFGESASADTIRDDSTRLDLSLSYRVNRQFTIYADFLNLTNDPLYIYFAGSQRPRRAEYFKWTANAGVRFRL